MTEVESKSAFSCTPDKKSYLKVDASPEPKERASSDPPSSLNQIESYYFDELGFYRHLDLEQMQYVCSNVSATSHHLQRNHHHPHLLTSLQHNKNPKETANELVNKLTSAVNDENNELFMRGMRRRLRISHFDKTYGYEEWKQEWDEFMRLKLTQHRPVTLNRELKFRIRSGIPHDYRCKVWAALIRMRTRHIHAQFGENVNVYANFASQVSEPDYTSANRTLESSKQKSSYIKSLSGSMEVKESQTTELEKFFKQIELDLLRTLPNNRHFEEPNSLGVQRVRRVLRTYAKFNPTVGYCQGMNRLAAMALLVLPEEEAFWCLVAIIQCIMPKDYYLKPWLAQVDCCVLNDLVEKKIPKLHKHLTKNDVQLTVFTWFFTIFVDGFRPELLLRIWDCFLLEGDKVLFRFALAILYISQEDLLKMQDFSSMNNHLSRLVSTRNLDVEHLFHTFNTLDPFPTKSLQSRRTYHIDRMQSQMAADIGNTREP